MAKLNQIIAVEKGVKAQAYSQITELHKAVQKADLFNGFSKSYQANDEDGEKLPSESKRVQFSVKDVLRALERNASALMNVTARKDWTNTQAVADVKLGDKVLLPSVPVTYLLFLEKQVTDLRTFVAALPVLESSEDWVEDQSSGLFKSEPVKTHRTNKIVKPIVLYDATENHPAQTQLITQDVIGGYWTTIKQSGSMKKPEKDGLLQKIDSLMIAIKNAREEANGRDEIESPDVGRSIFEFLTSNSAE